MLLHHAGVNISAFIDNLPHGKDTVDFSTPDASGSTSQAANIIEALEVCLAQSGVLRGILCMCCGGCVAASVGALCVVRFVECLIFFACTRGVGVVACMRSNPVANGEIMGAVFSACSFCTNGWEMCVWW